MKERDDWGRDPAVRNTREVFGLMEQGQKELLDRLGIFGLDPRLRRWRDQALAVFERSCAEAARSGRPWGAEDAAAEYVKGFVRILAAAGVDVSASEGNR